MKRPSGETVGLNFYFNDRSSADGLRDIVLYCLNHRASFSGEMIVTSGENARDRKFLHAYDHEVDEKKLNQHELIEHLNSPDNRVTTVGLWNAIGVTKNSVEIVTFNGISAEASAVEANPIAIIADGWHFSTPGYEKQRRQEAKICYRRFIDICRTLQPAYAAILNEDSLMCPHDLKQEKRVRSFANFFLSEQIYGSRLLTEIEALYQDAYIERLSQGLYIATWMFAPKDVTVDQASIYERSTAVAKRISSRFLSS